MLVCHLLFMGLVFLGVIIRGSYSPRPTGQYWELGVLVVVLMGIGIFQAVYIVPLSLYAKRKGKKLILQGILLSAALTLLGSGICGGMMWR